MDALERIGLKQLRENSKFVDYYRMVEGKLAFTEISQVIPQLRELGGVLSDMDIPAFLKHYDIIGIIVNAMTGEFMQTTDKYTVTNNDEISSNEYQREKTRRWQEYIKESFDKELEFLLAVEGIQTDPAAMGITSQEEAEKYLQQIREKKEKMTPPEIQKYMDKDWKTEIVKWAEHTLEQDRERFYFDELDREQLRDFLLTGRCFTHFYCGYDYYEPERWSPVNTFFDQTLETKYVQDGEYVGRVHYYTPNQVANKYGHLLSKQQKEDLLAGDGQYEKGGTRLSYSSPMEGWKKNFGQTQLLPHAGYHDHNFLYDIQEHFGTPLGVTTTIGKDGEKKTFEDFLPNQRQSPTGNTQYAQGIRQDLNLRSDMLQVTEAYWVSYQKVGYLYYYAPSGRLTQEIVTDDILKDFLKENEIKQVNTKSIKEIEARPEANTIYWDYVPQVYKGIKVNNANTRLKEALYLDVEPLPYQLKTNSEVYNFQLPVAGLVSTGIAPKLEPYQIGHNIAMNQKYNLMEKDLGVFFAFDINFLPSEMKEYGDTEEQLIHFRNMVRDTGLFPVDGSRNNLSGGVGFNQFAAHNLSFGQQIMEKHQIAEMYKMQAFEQIGFNPQRLGTPVKYETAEGVRNSQNASLSQTEIYFSQFSQHKTRSLEMHLNVAQYAQKSGKDIQVYYTKPDGVKAWFKMEEDPYFHLRKLGILPTSNAKQRKELETFKQYLLNTNTIGADETAIAELITSDTMIELVSIARTERLRREKQQQLEHQRSMEGIDRQGQILEAAEQKKWERLEITNERDRRNKLEIERIEALGRAADADAGNEDIQLIIQQTDMALKNQKQASDINIAQREQLRKENKDKQDGRIDMEKLKLELMKARTKLKEIEANKYIATINKN